MRDLTTSMPALWMLVAWLMTLHKQAVCYTNAMFSLFRGITNPKLTLLLKVGLIKLSVRSSESIHHYRSNAQHCG